jgi:hypothetical protein
VERFHADDAGWQRRHEADQLRAREPATEHELAVRVEAHRMEGSLAEVNAERANLHWTVLLRR